MFYILSKLLGFLASPTYWVAGLLIVFVVSGKRKWGWILLGFSLVFTNPFIYTTVVSEWSPELIPVARLEQHDIAIVLGGAARYEALDTNRVFLNGGSGDRIVQAIQLYKMGKVKKILFSGGSGVLIGERIPEAKIASKLFLMMGVPESDILLESQSRSTYENALYSSQILKKNFPGQKYLLITNAIHERRALACFGKQGVACTAFPIDNEHGSNGSDWLGYFIPQPYIIGGWDGFIHEWLGYMTYRLKGYC